MAGVSASHPYYPADLKLPGYAPPSLPFKLVLAIFFSASALLLLGSWVLSGDQPARATLTPGTLYQQKSDQKYRKAEASSFS